MLEERLIGYAAREMWLDFKQVWSLEHRQTFLLRTDIIKPLSVDTMIWTSAFSPIIAREIEQQTGRSDWYICLQLTNLERYLHEYKISDYWTIAITVITQFMDEETLNEVGIDYLPVIPEEIDPEWRFLGYDTAEMVMHSGLMNMGYTADDHNTHYPRKYAPHLNEYHLFTDVDIALYFAEWANTRDPGHGPFYVYGLYQIDSD